MNKSGRTWVELLLDGETPNWAALEKELGPDSLELTRAHRTAQLCQALADRRRTFVPSAAITYTSVAMGPRSFASKSKWSIKATWRESAMCRPSGENAAAPVPTACGVADAMVEPNTVRATNHTTARGSVNRLFITLRLSDKGNRSCRTSEAGVSRDHMKSRSLRSETIMEYRIGRLNLHTG